ncbi:hypothetical protein SLS56_007402 [Neofusicoccum ribis]|uniref:Uncharacterized protein n=1 Tax=Neofusicoccum ribis TaxID=45134 RepID=A0ABR3SN22_9PEZI
MAMHALLAVSASDMREHFPDAESQAHLHYGIAIGALPERMTQFLDGKPVDLPAMLLAIILLCSFEVYRGDEQKALSNHLHAIKLIVRTHMQDLRLRTDRDFLSFILDFYRHMSNAKHIISANEELHGLCNNRRSLMLGLQSIDELRRRLGFNCELSYPILADLPRSARLSSGRVLSIYDGTLCFGDAAQPRKACPPGLDGDGVAAGPGAGLPPPTKMVRQISLLVLLVVAHGSRASDDSLRGKIDGCVEEFLRELAVAEERHLVDAMMMWGYILMGSCARRTEHQAAIEFALRSSRFSRGFVEAMVELLRDMWADEDHMAFGPFGIKRALALQKLRFMSLTPSK